FFFFFSSRRRHTRFSRDWSSDVCSSDLIPTGEPARGDVMVFFPPDDPRYFIKRVIGLPGDHIVYRNRQLTINGEAVPTQELGGQPSWRPQKIMAQEQFGDTGAA